MEMSAVERFAGCGFHPDFSCKSNTQIQIHRFKYSNTNPITNLATLFGGCSFHPDFSRKSKYTNPNTQIQIQIQIRQHYQLGAVFTRISHRARFSHSVVPNTGCDLYSQQMSACQRHQNWLALDNSLILIIFCSDRTFLRYIPRASFFSLSLTALCYNSGILLIINATKSNSHNLCNSIRRNFSVHTHIYRRPCKLRPHIIISHNVKPDQLFLSLIIFSPIVTTFTGFLVQLASPVSLRSLVLHMGGNIIPKS